MVVEFETQKGLFTLVDIVLGHCHLVELCFVVLELGIFIQLVECLEHRHVLERHQWSSEFGASLELLSDLENISSPFVLVVLDFLPGRQYLLVHFKYVEFAHLSSDFLLL